VAVTRTPCDVVRLREKHRNVGMGAWRRGLNFSLQEIGNQGMDRESLMALAYGPSLTQPATHPPSAPRPSIGYVSGVWYKKMGGRQWVQNVLLSAGLFCGPLLAVFSVLNTVAWIQGSTQALPFGTICIIIVIWAVVTFPLTVLGGIWGKNSDAEYNAPCRWAPHPSSMCHVLPLNGLGCS
jgi:hypothetical protein